MRYCSLFIFVIFSCLNSSTKVSLRDINGLWAYVGKDSSYGEIFLTDSLVWVYDESGGPRIYAIRLFGKDSIEIIGDGIQIASMAKLPSKNRLVLTNNESKTEYFKVEKYLLSSDTMRSVFSGSSESIVYYIERFRARQDEWLSQKR